MVAGPARAAGDRGGPAAGAGGRRGRPTGARRRIREAHSISRATNENNKSARSIAGPAGGPAKRRRQSAGSRRARRPLSGSARRARDSECARSATAQPKRRAEPSANGAAGGGEGPETGALGPEQRLLRVPTVRSIASVLQEEKTRPTKVSRARGGPGGALPRRRPRSVPPVEERLALDLVPEGLRVDLGRHGCLVGFSVGRCEPFEDAARGCGGDGGPGERRGRGSRRGPASTRPPWETAVQRR